MLFQSKYFLYITLAVLYGAAIVSILFVFSEDNSADCYPFSQRPIKTYVPDEYTLSIRKALNDLKPLRLPVNSSLTRPFLRAKSRYRLSPRYNLSLCIVEKAMCTLLQSIFCYLYDPLGFVENNRTISLELWNGRFCEKRNEAESTQEKRLAAPFNPPTVFMVRNPYERFMSAFINKCINEKAKCYGCYEDLLCLVEGAHAEVMQMNVDHWDITIPKTSLINQSYEGQHFVPSNWQCDLYEEADNYIFFKYGETDAAMNQTFTDLTQLFEAHGVKKDKIEYILESVKTRTLHATKHSGLREKYFEQLRSSPKHVQLLNELYYYDNQIFGFEPLKANV